MNYEKESFPVKVTAKSTTAGGTFLYSWTEQGIGLPDGGYTSLASARTGTSNAREKNNSNLPVPFYAALEYEGFINGAPYYTFQGGGGGGNIASATFSGAQVAQVQSNFSVASGTFTQLSSSVLGEVFDTDGYTGHAGHLFNTNNKGNYFLITASVRWAANPTGSRYLQILANGHTVVSDCRSASSDNIDQCVTGVISVNMYNIGGNLPIDVQVMQTSGSALTLNFMDLPPYNLIAGASLVRLDPVIVNTPGGGGGGGGLVVGTTTISGGTSGSPLYDFGGVLGEIASPISGTFGG